MIAPGISGGYSLCLRPYTFIPTSAGQRKAAGSTALSSSRQAEPRAPTPFTDVSPGAKARSRSNAAAARKQGPVTLYRLLH
jgi:hypothetical protein